MKMNRRRRLVAASLTALVFIALSAAPSAQRGRNEPAPAPAPATDPAAAPASEPAPTPAARDGTAPQGAAPTRAQIDAALKDLAAGLASKEPADRTAALRRALLVPAPEVAAAATAALKDKSPDVQVAAMELLGTIRTPDGLKQLVRIASDKALRKDARLFSTSLKAIGRYGDKSSISVLADSPWDNTDASVVRARIMSLGNIRDTASIEALMSMMNKGGPPIGEDSPFMPDFRLALARLTGTDQTTNKSLWQSWWNKNKGFKVPADPPALTSDLQTRWDEYWGNQPAAAPAAAR